MNTDEKFEIILNKLDTIDGRLDAMDGRLDVMDGKISILEKDMSDVKSDVTSIQLQIENEIVPNTQRVAEWYQDLQRHLESEVEKIQKKIC